MENTNNNGLARNNPNGGKNFYVQRHYLKSIPIISNNNNHNQREANGGGFLVNNNRFKKANNINNPNAYHSFNMITNSDGQTVAMYPFVGGGAKFAGIESMGKPRFITVIRLSQRPRKKITILLNRKVMQSYEQFVADVSNAFGLPQWKNDKIRKLYTLRGRRVQSLSDFFRDDEIFIGFSGKEEKKMLMVKDLLEEMYPGQDELVMGILRDWESSWTRAARAEKNAKNNKNTGGNHRQHSFDLGSQISNRSLHNSDRELSDDLIAKTSNRNNSKQTNAAANVESESENAKRKRKHVKTSDAEVKLS